MSYEFCPICGDDLQKVQMNIGGTMYDFWVCPPCNWEDPASEEAAAALAAKSEGETR